MSGIGSGKSSKGGGAKSRSKGGKGDALHKKVSIQTSKDHLTTLRLALRDELGHDRDIISGFGAFTKYDRNDLALDIHFRTGSTITDEELEWAYELVSSNLGPLGHKWKPQALMDDLCDPSSRYALVTERASAAPAEKKPASKGKGKKKSSVPPIGKPVAFAHFRFTVQGETREAMEGEPVLMLRDLHVESDYQRKGLGKHLCQLLELSARKHAMRAMMMIVPSGSAGVFGRAFVDQKLKGFTCVDDDWKPVDKNLSSYSKSLVKAPVLAVKKPEAVSAASPDSILAGPERVEKENKEPEASVAKLETAFESATIAPAAEKRRSPRLPRSSPGSRPPFPWRRPRRHRSPSRRSAPPRPRKSPTRMRTRMRRMASGRRLMTTRKPPMTPPMRRLTTSWLSWWSCSRRRTAGNPRRRRCSSGCRPSRRLPRMVDSRSD